MIQSRSNRDSATYEQLLCLPDLSLGQIEEFDKKEDHAVWKALLKIEASNKITDHGEAITHLRLAHSQIVNFMRTSTSEQSQMIYRKTVVAVLTHLVNRLLAASRYKEAMEEFSYLVDQQLLNSELVRQALYNLFGLSSLLALSEYNLQSNAQFKYPSDTQIQFFYMLGKVKLGADKHNEARLALEKILMMGKTSNVSEYLMVRVLDLLADIDSGRYKGQRDALMKNAMKDNRLSDGEKASSARVIKELMRKEKEAKYYDKEEERVKISKRMLSLYLNKVLKEGAQDLTEKHRIALKESMARESNPIVYRELQKTSLYREASQYFSQKLKNIETISLNYYFRKLFNIEQSKMKSTKLKPIKQESVSKISTKSLPKARRERQTTPLNLERTKEILKKCANGSLLMKVNFGNSSIVERYVRILEKALVWGNGKEDTDYSSSCCKWKNVLGLTYGKVSENLSKDKFWKLQPWQCFSLITKDRSFDFYCQNESDIFFWLQGISFQLQLFHKNSMTYPFYSKGRALWKMILLKMGTRFNDPKKKSKCRNAGAVIGFQKLRRL